MSISWDQIYYILTEIRCLKASFIFWIIWLGYNFGYFSKYWVNFFQIIWSPCCLPVCQSLCLYSYMSVCLSLVQLKLVCFEVETIPLFATSRNRITELKKREIIRLIEKSKNLQILCFESILLIVGIKLSSKGPYSQHFITSESAQ
jgi:hypothetical protein